MICLGECRRLTKLSPRPCLALPAFSRANAKDLVLLCGSPGAGKSTFYWRHLKPLGYERVNQDILKTVRPPQVDERRSACITQLYCFSPR